MKNLLKAIHAVMGEVDYVQKTEKNQYQGYSYANELALLSNLRPALLKHGLVICPSLDSVGDWCDTNGNTHIVMCFTIYHVETGENLSCRIPAAGNDLYRSGKVGDKGIYSALTGATKYFLFKTFLLPTGDDPESRKETDVAGNEKKEAPKTNINLADHANGSAPVKDKQAFNEWADEFLSFIKEMKANNDIDGAMKNAKATLTLIKSRFPDIYDRVEIGVKHHRKEVN